MRQHELRAPWGARKGRKRVGRGIGSGHGKTSGRGMGGQRARSNPGIRPYFEGGQLPLIRRLPRKRGFTNIFRTPYHVVNVGRLAKAFGPGETITPRVLKERRILRNLSRPVKVLSEGALEQPLHIYAHAFSEGAMAKVKAAGGSCTVLDPQVVDAPAEGAERVEVEQA